MDAKIAPLIQYCNRGAHGALGERKLAFLMASRSTNKSSKPSTADIVASERLKRLWNAEIRRRKGSSDPLTQDVMASMLADATGKGTQGLVSQYINGKIPLNYRAVMLFAQVLGCEPRAIRSDLPEFKVSETKGSDDPMWPSIIGVKQAASLGDGAALDEYAETHKLKFRADSLRRKHLQPANLAVVYGKGDSMHPTILSGDAIMFDRADTQPRDGQLYVISYDGDLIAKRLMELDGAWYASSDNDDDPKWRKPKRLDPSRGVEIAGRIRWVARWVD